eukprot:CAMPEP_0182894718 /NCGR_PEP_ID=MMETSP0034_2-20130328/25241_1 /TAXON_ID=156128 /ORGANISM="Nephroselmis pyriformis, Strain CCMP717" /LENGTH=389 /DNA_ID=CAMNT_0025028507 /DNA_START=9 /DNA_END=1178 /DNA_ORIENTATION=-
MKAAKEVEKGEMDPKVPGVADGLVAELICGEGWFFDAFRVEDLAGGATVSTLTFWLLVRCGAVKELGLKPEKLMAYLRAMEPKYAGNPYHNGTHAADVAHSMYALMVRGGVIERLGLGKFELLACVFSAAIHDYDHRGVNNDFLVRSADDLAMRYNDCSPMENHHLSASFLLMREPGCDFLAELSGDKRLKFREMVISLVLSTDMKRHFNIEKAYKDTVLGAAPDEASGAGGASSSGWVTGLPEASKTTAMQVALKLADVGCMASEAHIMDQWVKLLEEEMFCQGDREKREGMQVSSLMDRTDLKTGGSAGPVRTLNFYSLFILPLASSFLEAFPGGESFNAHIRANFELWQKRAEELNAASGEPSCSVIVTPKSANLADIIPGFKQKG